VLAALLLRTPVVEVTAVRAADGVVALLGHGAAAALARVWIVAGRDSYWVHWGAYAPTIVWMIVGSGCWIYKVPQYDHIALDTSAARYLGYSYVPRMHVNDYPL
jgi:hypothetical protein